MNILKGYRTIILNVAAMALPILQLQEIIAVIPAEWMDEYVIGVAVLNVVLRFLTTTPIGKAA